MAVYVHTGDGAIVERNTCTVCKGERTETQAIQQMGGRTQDIDIACRECGGKGYADRALPAQEELMYLRADRLEMLEIIQETMDALHAALKRLYDT